MARPSSKRQSVPTHPTGDGWAHQASDSLSWATGQGARSAFLSASSAHGSPPPSAAGSRRALCLWLPTFELRLELVRSPELDSTSVALLAAGERTRRTVRQVSERAWEAGVRPDQLVSQAVSLCPSLTLLEPDPAHYDAANDAMLEALSELTPVVEPAGRGRVFLGMDGLERLFGPPDRQARIALRTLFRVFPAPLVASTRAGMAPGKFGAWVAATAAGPGTPVVVAEEELADFLAPCPVGVLPVDPLMVQRMERLDISSLEALRRFPEPSLVAQFGAQGRDALAWARAERIDPVRPWHRPRPIRVTQEFPDPVGMMGALHAALERMVKRGLGRRARRGRSIAQARLGAQLEGGGSWRVETTFREPTGQAERLVFALRSRMDLSPPPRAVDALFLEFTRFGVASAQANLFDRSTAAGRDVESSPLEEGQIPISLKDAVRELKLRLGHSPLYRVVEIDPWSRIPERRHALMSFDPS